MSSRVLSNNLNLFSSPSSTSINQQEQRNYPASVYPKSRKVVKLKSQALRSDYHGKKFVLLVNDHKGFSKRENFYFSIKSETGLRIGKIQIWWQKGLLPNMKEVSSAQDLVDSLMNAGDKLVIVDFFSPGCGGCRALHPKICQFAEMNPDVQFLQVNYEEHKSMCYSLNVHVLPFFRFYKGAHGRLCSFSCTNATIKKFKDALAKHTPEKCSLGPTKGLEEKELVALAANKELSFTYMPKPKEPVPGLTPEKVAVIAKSANSKRPVPSTTQNEEEKTFVFFFGVMYV